MLNLSKLSNMTQMGSILGALLYPFFVLCAKIQNNLSRKYWLILTIRSQKKKVKSIFRNFFGKVTLAGIKGVNLWIYKWKKLVFPMFVNTMVKEFEFLVDQGFVPHIISLLILRVLFFLPFMPSFQSRDGNVLFVGFELMTLSEI